MPPGVTAGTLAETKVRILDYNNPQVGVQFGAESYAVAESDDPTTPTKTENQVEITVTLTADPKRTVVIPIKSADEHGANVSHLYGVPDNITFNSGEVSKTFTFTARDDGGDDDESVRLYFGENLPRRVTQSVTRSHTTVTVTDDDDPSVMVNFTSKKHSVEEGDTHNNIRLPQRGPEADGGHPHQHYTYKRGDRRRLLGRAGKHHLQQRGNLQNLHLLSH